MKKIALFLFLTLLPIQAFSITYAKFTPEELFNDTENIVFAQLTDKQYFAKKNLPFTLLKFKVLDVYKGNLKSNDIVEIEFIGGNAGGKVGSLPGAPKPNINDRTMLLLSDKQKSGKYVLKAFANGFFSLKKVNDKWIFPKHLLKRLPQNIRKAFSVDTDITTVGKKIKQFSIKK